MPEITVTREVKTPFGSDIQFLYSPDKNSLTYYLNNRGLGYIPVFLRNGCLCPSEIEAKIQGVTVTFRISKADNSQVVLTYES